MARTIAQIKSEITTAFMADTTLAASYGFTIGDSFDSTFSKVSLENILFFIVASAIWTLETLFDLHATAMTNLINTQVPHKLKWYCEKILAFQYGDSLIVDTDTYAVVDATKQVVSYASALEYHGEVYIKVATGTTTKSALPVPQQTALTAYVQEFKDAGVIVNIVNEAADHFSLVMNVYYDPMVLDGNGNRLDNGSPTVVNMINDYIQNQLPFNGEYRNSSFVDVLQALDGVVIADLILAKTISDANFRAAGSAPVPWVNVVAKTVPDSGYFQIYSPADLQLTFIAYQTIPSV